MVAGLVGILTICLLLYGSVAFGSQSKSPLPKKTLSGRELPDDPLQVGGLQHCLREVKTHTQLLCPAALSAVG